MVTKRDELLKRVFEDMDTAKRLIHNCFANTLGALNVSPAQAHVLFVVQDGQPISLKALAERMWLTPGAITQLVDGLARLHCITRTQDKKDRRITYISLSSSGSALLAKITERRNEAMTQIMGTLNEEELKQLAIIQHKMASNLGSNIKDAVKKEKTW